MLNRRRNRSFEKQREDFVSEGHFTAATIEKDHLFNNLLVGAQERT